MSEKYNETSGKCIAIGKEMRYTVNVTKRDSNQRGFERQTLGLTASKRLAISYIASPFFLVSPNRLLSQNCFAPLGESIFDEFLWDEVQESVDFSNRVTQKGAEIDRREAHGFESRLVT